MLLVLLLCAVILASLSYGQIVFCNIKIWGALNAKKHLMSERTKKVQRELTYALIMQVNLDF